MTSPERRPEEKRRRIGVGAPPAAILDDVLFGEVLPRLPIKSIVRFRSVCRAWRDAVDGGAVARRRLELSRSSPPAMLVIPREDWDNNLAERSAELNFYRLLLADGGAPAGDAAAAAAELVLEKALPGAATVTHEVVPTHCDGLVAVATRDGEVFVCNPATRELVALPPGTPSVRDDAYAWGARPAAIAYDASRRSYVVARYFYREFHEAKDANGGNFVLLKCDIGREVFTLGAGGGGGWEVTGDPPHPIAFARPVCTRDAIYWCADADYQQDDENALVRFDLRDRAFDVVPPPPGADMYSDEQHVAELEGKLYYVDYVDTAVDVWVADEVGVGRQRRPEWTLRCRLDFGGGVFGSGEAILPVADDGEEMLVAVDYRKLYRYSECTKSLSLVVDMAKELVYQCEDGSLLYGDGDGKFFKHHVVPYVESLVSIRGRQ
ncbi:unnamed protein product [Urochloa decumbens]|uniref:F-box domain-containing protein n=1 Tax=Urochloa decumbens TaxID=240449 RepID=A0ABC9F1D7_9POAL